MDMRNVWNSLLCWLWYPYIAAISCYTNTCSFQVIYTYCTMRRVTSQVDSVSPWQWQLPSPQGSQQCPLSGTRAGIPAEQTQSVTMVVGNNVFTTSHHTTCSLVPRPPPRFYLAAVEKNWDKIWAEAWERGYTTCTVTCNLLQSNPTAVSIAVLW